MRQDLKNDVEKVSERPVADSTVQDQGGSIIVYKSELKQAVDYLAALANLIANLTLDTEENKTILKQLKKANASLTQEQEECKTNLDDTSRALGEATSRSGNSCSDCTSNQTD
ncbi:hypothetical protein Tco_0609125 [Tanacetum coccineum]